MNRAMKDSEIKWLGEIPESWKIIRVKNKYKYNKEIVGDRVEQFERLSLTLNGVLKRPKDANDGLQPEKFEGYQILRENQLVFKLIDLENVRTSRVGLSPYTGIVSPAYIVLDGGGESKFGYYYFFSMWQREIFNKLGGDGVRSNLNTKDLLSIPYIDVPMDEQNKITAYLDNEVSNINRIIEKTKRTIAEYKKYKESFITDVVIKGIREGIKMKDSGVDWIGLMPKHTKLIKMKYLFEIKKDIAGEEGYDILSVTQKGIKIKDISKNEGQIAMDYSKYQIVDKDDFVMNHMDLLTGWVDCSKYEGVTSPDYRVFRFINPEEHSKEYYTYLMQICYSNKIFYGLGQGVSNLGRWRLQTDKFLNFQVPVPTLEEQQEIVKYLDKKCVEIDKLIDKKEQLIIELESYKKSLIYECVTGKKEI